METYAGLRPEDLDAAFERGTEMADGDIRRAVATAGSGDADAVLAQLELASRHARSAYGRSTALWTVHPDPVIREAAGTMQTRYDAWRSSVFGRQDLFNALVGLGDASLSAARRRHLGLWRAAGRINGAHLDPAARSELTAARARESELAIAIAARFVDEAPIMELTRDELDGLPAALLDTLDPGVAPGTLRLRVEIATRGDVLTGVRRRDIRDRFWWLLTERSAATNLEPLRELFDARRRIAHLAGFASWADLRTSTASMRSVDAAMMSIDEVAEPAHAATKGFIAACEAALGDRLGPDGLQPWDQFLGAAELGRALGVDAESLRRFLPLDGVLEGLFRLSQDVFGIRVEELPEALGWHEDVRTLALIDDATDEQIGLCLFDPFTRNGKMASTSAFMDLLEADPPTAGGVLPPAVTMLVTMFPKPFDGRSVLLSPDDVDGLFHEFGHVLDFTIGSRHAPAMDDGWWGTDWSEGPALSMGAWARVPEVLAT